MAPLNKKFFVSSTLALNAERGFLDVAARAGVRNFYCTMNVDPVSLKALQGGRRERQILTDLIKSLDDRGIRFFASFGLGRDWDDADIADRVLELCARRAFIRRSFCVHTIPWLGPVGPARASGKDHRPDVATLQWRARGCETAKNERGLRSRQLVKVWREFYRSKRNGTWRTCGPRPGATASKWWENHSSERVSAGKRQLLVLGFSARSATMLAQSRKPCARGDTESVRSRDSTRAISEPTRRVNSKDSIRVGGFLLRH